MVPCLRCLAGLTLVLAIAAGCSRGSKHTTESVHGTVTLDDKPVSGATITFIPVDESQGVPATGTTDEQGRFTLATIGKGPSLQAGVVAGEYYVSVMKDEIPSYVDENDPAYEKLASQSTVEKDKQPRRIVPQKYNDPKKSGIKVTVEQGKSNDIPLKLTSK